MPGSKTDTNNCQDSQREVRVMRDTGEDMDVLDISYRNGHSYRSPVKAYHDFSPTIQDSDSGISNTYHQPLSRTTFQSEYGLSGDDLMSRSPLSLSLNSKTRSFSASSSLSASGRASPIKGVDRTLKDLQDTLRDSESRRNLLMNKLKEAQDTIMLQSKRLNTEISSPKKELEAPSLSSIEVAELQVQKKEYLTRIDKLERDRDHQQRFTIETSKLRHNMQDRMDSLDLELKSIKSQYNLLQAEHRKRLEILDQTSSAMALLEEENAKLVKAKESQMKELVALRESLNLSRNRNETMEDQMKDLKHDVDRFREENHLLTTQNIQLTQQAAEIRNTHAELKMETNQLIETVKTLGDEKQKLLQKVHNYHDALEDLKSNMSSISADKERFFQEKLDLHQKVQTLNLDKDRLQKEKYSFEEQLSEAHADLAQIKLQVDKRSDEKRRIQEELEAVKKVGEVLSAELSSTKSALDESTEQVTHLENGKRLLQQKVSSYEQEVSTLQGQLQTMSRTVETMRNDHAKEKEQFDQQNIQLREEIRKMKQEKYDMENRCFELESKMKVVTNELETKLKVHEGEVESWKKQCEKLRNALEQKEESLQQCSQTIGELEQQSAQMKLDHENTQALYEEVLGIREEMQRLHEENEHLHQERAENQQIIQLLEMQKNILSKTSENGLGRAEGEALQCQVDQLTAENSLLQDKIKGLERVRDELIQQKENFLVSGHSDFTKHINTSQEEKPMAGQGAGLVHSVSANDLEKQNQQLRDLNDMITERLNKLEKENMHLKQITGQEEEMVSKSEYKRLEREKQMLDVNYKQLKSDYDVLEEAHHKFLIGDKNVAKKEAVISTPAKNDKEESQVALLNGQIVLLENSKKRLEDQVQKQQRELVQVKERLAALSDSNGDNDTELYHMRREISKLKMELEDSQNVQSKQEALLKSYKEELEDERTKKPTRIKQSLEDVEWELSTMRTELQKLMEVIQMKDHEIEGLEIQLKASQDEAKNREKMIQDMQSQTKLKLETHNEVNSHTVTELEGKVASLEKEKARLTERIKQLESEKFDLMKRQGQNNACILRNDAEGVKEGQLREALEKEKEKQEQKSAVSTSGSNKKLDICDSHWYYLDNFEGRNLIPAKSPESEYAGDADTESITENLTGEDISLRSTGDALELRDSRLHHAMKGSIPSLLPDGTITPHSSYSPGKGGGNSSTFASPVRSSQKDIPVNDTSFSPVKSLADELDEEERAGTPGLLSQLDPLAKAPPSEDGEDEEKGDGSAIASSQEISVKDSSSITLSSTPANTSEFKSSPSHLSRNPYSGRLKPTKIAGPPWK